jgi:hypothetical protein
MQHLNIPTVSEKVVPAERIHEARYAYYRRCHVFRRNGEQCKAPAEKGSQICYAHAGQLATAVRRERERRAVLAEAVAEMRRQGRPECEMADLFTSFKGIQVTTAVMARAVITGRIDCKTAGQMVVHLQTCSKLLWQIHRRKTSATESRRHGEDQKLPQICADERRLNLRAEERPKTLPLIYADDTDQKKLPEEKLLPRIDADDADQKEPSVRKNLTVTFSVRSELELKCAKVLQFKEPTFGERCRGHSPPKKKVA